MDLIQKAWNFALKKHEGQLDDTGAPYFKHPAQVYDILIEVVPSDHNLLAAALLHDTLEDTETTYEELVKEFNQDVADLVNEVTHDGAKDNYGLYFPRLHSKRGILLKFADRLSNLSRMENWDKERQEHYLRKSKFWKDGTDKPNL